MIGKKEGIRLEHLKRRKRMTPDEVAARSAAVVENAFTVIALREACCVMAYVAVRNEVDAAPLIIRVLADGKVVALPVTDPARRMLRAATIDSFPGNLVTGAYGIPEPPPGSRVLSPVDLDCIIVPGVAFDEQGYRLGFGKGYYDRFLASTKRAAAHIGLAYEWQVCRGLPHEAHDFPVDYLVTESRVLAFNKHKAIN